MENARWNGQLLMASEISKDYIIEKEIRKASGHKELRCPDPGCQNPVLRYCHGEMKDAYFAHLNNANCDYAYFDNEIEPVVRNVRRNLYDILKSKGYNVQLEVKILDHYYTHILLNMEDGNRLAIEIGTQRISANRIDSLTDEYLEKGISVKWIVIDNPNINVRERQTFFLKRYSLNESKNKDLLVVDSTCKEITQYKVDPNKYVYHNGQIMSSENYPETFKYNALLSELAIEGGDLTIVGFNEEYENWLKRKLSAFEKRVKQLDEEFIEEQRQRKNKIEHQTSSIEQIKPKIEYSPTSEEILNLLAQQDTVAYDSIGRRWIKCEKCSHIGTDDDFSSYGGYNRANLGICYSCSGSGRPMNFRT